MTLRILKVRVSGLKNSQGAHGTSNIRRGAAYRTPILKLLELREEHGPPYPRNTHIFDQEHSIALIVVFGNSVSPPPPPVPNLTF